MKNVRALIQRGYTQACDIYDSLGRKIGVTVATTIGTSAMAQTVGTDPFDTALTDITTKTGTYAAALVGVSAIAVGFMVAMKYVKKLPRAS